MTVWHERVASITVYRSVLERHAPKALASLDALLPGAIGAGKALQSP